MHWETGLCSRQLQYGVWGSDDSLNQSTVRQVKDKRRGATCRRCRVEVASSRLRDETATSGAGAAVDRSCKQECAWVRINGWVSGAARCCVQLSMANVIDTSEAEESMILAGLHQVFCRA